MYKTEEKDDTGKVMKAAPTTAEKTELERIHKEWSVKNRKVAQLLVMYCTDKPASIVEDIDDAFLIWYKLKENYQDSGFTARHTAFQKLTTTTIGDCEGSVDSYIHRIRTNAKDLKNMNTTVPDWILILTLLNNLDEKYTDFVHRIVLTATGEPDFKEVVKLLYKEDRLAKREVISTAMVAARTKAQKSLKQTEIHEEGEYKNCPKGKKKKIHPKETYWTLHLELRPDYYKTKNEKANTAAGRNHDQDDDDMVAPQFGLFTSIAVLSPFNEEDVESNIFQKETIFTRTAVLDKRNLSFDIYTPLPKSSEEDVPKGQGLLQIHPLRQSESCSVKICNQMPDSSSVHIASTTPLIHKVTDWIIDSRYTNHIYHDREDFISYTSLRNAIHIADGTTIYAQGRGSINIEFILLNDKARVTRIDNVLHIPQLQCGLFSIY
ncbi:hypothetical protein OEA41_004026 [Lepraria neglecta]|uniref:Retrovirus-related Pol polyprotein from transposon TNT 1-94-like beta-barrel domain-containing protein n=1 Tax=Lepraria neglecta TaxID=209136 RepID=A0AAE0DIZ4_9LECA|nr:hypothetical protein OEA41_004026 [Lepraria neglecta]